MFQVIVGDGIFNLVLDGSAQWAGPHLRIVAQVHQFFLDLVGDMDVDAIARESGIDIIQHEVHNFEEMGLIKGLELDDAVKTVHKFRAEEVAQLTKD